ncbi:MAG: ATP-binding protein [Hyphomicrobiaceae bacterium]|nr:ATP-binding protein [Hyphomicrobiaceae bacterium]
MLNSPAPAVHSTPDAIAFLRGRSEMASRIREHDWARTPLGPPAAWPQSLKTAVRIMLTSRQPIWIGWGRELIYLYNDPYKAIIGGKHPAALGKPTAQVWREIWPEIGPMLATAMGGDEGTYVERQLLIMERNGYPEETYYTFSYSPVPGDDGQVGGIICANTDDTDRVISQRRLQLLRDIASQSAKARSAAEACVQAARALAAESRDLPFTLTYLARAGATDLELLAATGIEGGTWQPQPSLPAAGSPTWPIAGILRSGEQRLIAAPERAGLPTGAWDQPAREIALVPFAVSGEAGWQGLLVAGLNPFRPYDDRTRDFLSLVAGQLSTAIGTADEFEAERRRAQALAELDRAKTQFFSNISHEFRTPLTLQLGAVETLLKDRHRLDPSQLSELSVAHRNGMRLLRLVNALLDFSRIEAGRMKAVFVPVDLGRFTSDLASNFRSACEKAGLALAIDCQPSDEQVWIDPDLMEKVVLNLISNAFKFTFDGGIRVALRYAPGYAELSVEDTGTGIPEDEIARLFERFHRIEGARGRSHEGTGIGLALVKELVHLHGGSIGVDSEFGRGSAFRVRLPLGNAHLPRERLGASRDAQEASRSRVESWLDEAMSWRPEAAATDAPLAEAAPAFAPGDTRNWRVLVADDNADLRAYLVRLLSPYWQVEAVGDGAAALAAASARVPDLILSDVMMPRLDGFGLLRAVREDARLRTVPVVLLSARAGEEAHAEGLEAGADDYLVKPFTARELIVRVGSALKMARVRRDAAEAVAARTRELEAVLDTVPAGVWFISEPDTAVARSNRRGAEMLGLEADAGASPAQSEPGAVRVLRHGVELDRATLPLYRAARGEAVGEEELEIERRGGARRTLLVSAAAIRREDGGVTGAVAAAVDITSRKETELALLANAQKLEHASAAAGIGFWELNLDTSEMSCSPQFRADFGLPPDAPVDFSHVLAALHPDDRSRVEAALADAVATGSLYQVECRNLRHDGTVHWVNVRGQVLPAEGSPLLMLGVTLDVTERKRAEEHLQLLMREVNHRAKNMLTLVQAIARQTASSSPADFVGRFSQRVLALAANQDLLVKNDWRGVDISDLAYAQLAPFADLIGSRILVSGPSLRLSPNAAQAIGMALHELATNAGKYGALSGHAGKVEIAWQLGNDRFSISWIESGGPPVSAPTRVGFGSSIVKSMLKVSLSCDVDLAFAPAGIAWTLECTADRVLELGAAGDIHTAHQMPEAAS